MKLTQTTYANVSRETLRNGCFVGRVFHMKHFRGKMPKNRAKTT